MTRKNFFRLLLFFLLGCGLFVSAFFYEFLSASGNIFSQGRQEAGTPQTSIVKQFSDMIISPSQQLSGEKDGQINILLLGIGGDGHSGGQLTDTIMVLSLKPLTHEAALLSIPRDLYVEVTGTDIKNKINAVRELGDQREPGSGIGYLEQTVKDISGLDIDYYVQLDFTGFTRIVDAVGGIDVYLEKDINDETYPDSGFGYDPFRIEKGWHHLDGATALKVARSRHTGAGDFDRMKRQQAILVAFRQKLYEKYAHIDLLAFREIFLSVTANLKTDIELKELPRFYQVVKETKSSNFTASNVDTSNYLRKINVGLGYTLSTQTGDYTDTNEFAANMFDMQLPEKKAPLILEESALIAIENGTGSPDLANTIAANLETLGLRIISTTNIDKPAFDGVELRYASGADTSKPETFAFLTKKFSAKSAPADGTPRADFTIMLGNGF